MSLRLRKLKLVVVTQDGLYGRNLDFDPGLNILRADNTAGKSTCTQAIIYALGLEAMLSAKHAIPLPHAMKDYLEANGDMRLDVKESEVWIEIENGDGKQLTIRRTVKGERDKHLVTVWDGPKLSDTAVTATERDYFVRQPGAATRTRGFHQFLASFIGWKLPEVTTFDGESCPLYLECIFPLMLIEQKRGWSGIQTAMPLQFKIRDVRKRALEFILDLDAHRNTVRRAALEQRKSVVRRSWTSLSNKIGTIAQAVGGEIQGLPAEPTAIWPPEVEPVVLFERSGKPISLENLIKLELASLREIEREKIPRVEADAKRLNKLLLERSDELLALSLAISDLKEEIGADKSDLQALRRRLEALKEDIVRHKDIKRLKKMGSVESFSISSGSCPTCQQEVEDTLLSQREKYHPISVEENIAFLEAQKRTFKAMEVETKRSIQISELRLERLQTEAADLRSEIRSIKSSLISDARAPSEAAIERRLRLRSTIESLQRAHDQIGSILMEVESLSEEWSDILKQEATLPKGVLSRDDQEKLNLLGELIHKQLNQYGLKSLNPNEFSISRDTYLPIYEDFDLGFDLSASDVVRLVWAYLVSLLEVAREKVTNHPNFLVLDEPQQQSIKDISFEALLKRTQQAGEFGQQVIIAMSELPVPLEKLLTKGTYKLLDIKGWILQKLEI